jgi:phage shock protein C
MLGGVAGGLGRYFAVDPLFVRIAFVILAFAGGLGIVLYLVAWILIPAEQPDEPVGPPPPSAGPGGLPWIAGLALVAVGFVLLLRLWFDLRYLWPILLIALGLAVLARSRRP